MLALSNISIIILAAGRGTRMGSAHPSKLLLPWRDGKSILWHTVQSALSLGPYEVVVVVRPDLPEMVEALGGLPVRCVPNPRYMEGMGTSLAVGIGALGDEVEAALLMLGDEPEVPRHIVERLVTAYRSVGEAITIPRYGEQAPPPRPLQEAEGLHGIEIDLTPRRKGGQERQYSLDLPQRRRVRRGFPNKVVT